MTAATLIAIAFSGALLILLGARDPKRLRNARHGAKAGTSPLPPAVRHACGWLSLAPGIALGILGKKKTNQNKHNTHTAIGWSIAITAGYNARPVASHRSES